MLPLYRKDINGLECAHGAIPWTELPRFTAFSGILKIHGIAPEYKY